MFRSIIITLMLIFGFVFSSPAQLREIPKDRKEINMCGMSFIIPKNMKDQKVQGIDSCVAEFKSKTLRLGFDYGMYTAPPGEIERGTKREELVIDGKKAILTTSAYGAGVYILVSEGEDGTTALGMSIGGKTTAAAEIAKQIIQSIRFVKKN